MTRLEILNEFEKLSNSFEKIKREKPNHAYLHCPKRKQMENVDSIKITSERLLRSSIHYFIDTLDVKVNVYILSLLTLLVDIDNWKKDQSECKYYQISH